MHAVQKENRRFNLKLFAMLPLLAYGWLLVSPTACSNKEMDEPYTEIVNNLEISSVELLTSDPDLSLFLAAIEKADLSGKISDSESILILAPTDLALNSQGSEFLLKEMIEIEDVETRLLDQLKHHIVENPELPASIGNYPMRTTLVRTLSGHTITIRGFSSTLVVGRDTFVTKIVNTSNGTILYIDGLLWAPDKIG